VIVDDRGALAYATHRGRRHQRNEDAAALATTAEGWPVLVVADGVSASPNPDVASAAAVAAAAIRLADRPFAVEDDLAAAVAAAHEAASATPAAGDPHWADDGTHPACTIVVAVATDAAVHLANVGDARAYVLTRAGHGPGVADGAWSATQASTDDSVAARAVAEGIEPGIALSVPGGHAITAWLGADAHGLDPHLATLAAAPGDVVLVCSDGLWNYAPTDQAMGALMAGTLPASGATGPLAPLCERLVSWAVEQGGADNITVALAPVRPAPGQSDPDEMEDDA
jgi:serine/threonine protein phosphatase PrpC